MVDALAPSPGKLQRTALRFAPRWKPGTHGSIWISPAPECSSGRRAAHVSMTLVPGVADVVTGSAAPRRTG